MFTPHQQSLRLPQQTNNPLHPHPCPPAAIASSSPKQELLLKSSLSFQSQSLVPGVERVTSLAAEGLGPPHPFKGTKCFIISTGGHKTATGLVFSTAPLDPSPSILHAYFPRIMATTGLGCLPLTPPEAPQPGLRVGPHSEGPESQQPGPLSLSTCCAQCCHRDGTITGFQSLANLLGALLPLFQSLENSLGLRRCPDFAADDVY